MAQDDVGIESIMALIGNSAMLINGAMTAVIKLMEAVWKVTKAATIPGIGIAKTTFRNWKDDRELKERFGELADFVKATSGKFELINLPIQWCDQYGTSIPENEEKLKKLERECRNAGIRIHALPDINGSDGLTQYAVATDDFKHFQTIYKDFLLNDIPHMGGMNYAQLTAMSGGQVAMKSVRIEENTEEDCKTNPDLVQGAVKPEQLEWLSKKMDSYKIHYTICPDAKLGDGQMQIAFLPAEAEKVASALEDYRKYYYPYDESISKDIQTEDIIENAMTNVDEYVAHSDPQIQNVLVDKGDQQPYANFEKALGKGNAKVQNSDAYLRALHNPRYERVTANEKLVHDYGSKLYYLVRAPYTKDYYQIERDMIFCLGGDTTKTYAVFLDKQKTYNCYQNPSRQELKTCAFHPEQAVKKSYIDVQATFRPMIPKQQNKTKKELKPRIKL